MSPESIKSNYLFDIKCGLSRLKNLLSSFIISIILFPLQEQISLAQINTLETVNSFYGHWCCANDNYLYGTDVNNLKVVLRKSQSGQSFETRGSVTSLDPSFIIEHKIFATSTPGLIFTLVRDNASYYLLKSNNGAATFTNVFAFGEGNGIEGANSPDIRILRGILELKRDIPGGGGTGTLYLGEYNVCRSRISGSTNDRVRIMKSVDNGDTWTKVMEWNTNGSNQVGHIHAMKQDPYTGEIYICTGDSYNKAAIIKWNGSSAWEDNKTIPEIGRMDGFSVFTGAQRYRVCDVLFDEDYFYTFVDTQKPSNPTGSESGIWRGTKNFRSYRRMDNKILDYDPMHVGWYGEKIGNTFIFTTSREYEDPENAWKELNTLVYCSTDGENWNASGVIDWRDYGTTTNGRYIDNVFSYNNRLYIDCVEGAGHASTIQCELKREWKTYEDPVILHPVYFVGTWNAAGNDANPGTNPDAPKRTLNSALISNRISAGARVRVAAGNFQETNIYPVWSGAMFQGRGSVVIEGQGMDKTHIIGSSGSGNTYGIYVEAARTLTDSNTPLILKDLDIYVTVDGQANHQNYVLNNKDSYVKTIGCRIGNADNDDSPLVNLGEENSRFVSENSVFTANARASIYKNIVRMDAANTVCHLKNCIILNAYNAFDNNYPGIDFSLKHCTLYAIENAGVVFEPSWNTMPVIKNCIFSCGAAPVRDLSGLVETDIDYNLYSKPLSNLVDGGHSLDIGTDPLFADAANLDFNLKSNSPCAMKGLYLSDVIYDFAGSERNNPPCIGAYENTALSVTPIDSTIPSTSGTTIVFHIISNTHWNVSYHDNWISLSSLSGNASGTITATFSANMLTSSRVGTITISGSGVSSQSVTVTQSGVSSLSVTPSDQDTGSEAGSTTFNIVSNTSWTISDDASWLTVNPASGNGDETISAAFTDNPLTSPRVGTITISGTGVSSRSVTISQRGRKTLSVTPSNRNTESDAGSITFDISSNTNWTASDDASWLTVSPESGSGNGTITATFTANTLTLPRIGTITISGTEAIFQSATVSQNIFLSVPALFSPVNNLTGIGINPELTWNITPGALSYGLQVSKNPDFITAVIERQSIIRNSFVVSDLDINTNYYWRVRATYPEGTSRWSEIWGFTTETSSGPEPIITDHFIVLKQNYPNPFKDNTTIELYISKPCQIEISIFNNLGEEIYNAKNEYHEAGFNTLNWIPPYTLKSGTYYCQLRVNNIRRIIKMIYLNSNKL